MKVIWALLAGVGTAALIYDLDFVLEGLLAGLQVSLSLFVFWFAANMTIGLPVAVLAGLPIWLVFQHWRIRSPQAFALLGASLALATYLLLVATGMGEPSDHPMTFTENIARLSHVPRIAAVMLAGASGAIVFRHFEGRLGTPTLIKSPRAEES